MNSAGVESRPLSSRLYSNHSLTLDLTRTHSGLLATAVKRLRRVTVPQLIGSKRETMKMKPTRIQWTVAATALLAALGGIAIAAQDRYALQVPGGLAFAEFRGYQDWQIIAVSHNGEKLAAILGNPSMIEAHKAGIPGNGKPFPDGAKMAKIHWNAQKAEDEPGEPIVPGALHDVDFMAKDSKRFADSGGWGYAQFEYDPASQTFRPGDSNDTPPQEHDAKCGFACHTIVAAKDYVFTAYPQR